MGSSTLWYSFFSVSTEPGFTTCPGSLHQELSLWSVTTQDPATAILFPSHSLFTFWLNAESSFLPWQCIHVFFLVFRLGWDDIFLHNCHDAVPSSALTPQTRSLISKTQARTELLVYIISKAASPSHPHLAAFPWCKQPLWPSLLRDTTEDREK